MKMPPSQEAGGISPDVNRTLARVPSGYPNDVRCPIDAYRTWLPAIQTEWI